MTPEEHQQRIRAAFEKHVLPLIGDAKKDGYAADVFASLDMDAKPQVRVGVSLR